MPMRHLTVTGTATTAFMAATHSPTSAGSAIKQAPKRPLRTRSDGQPTLRLISSKPASAQMRADAASASGSHPPGRTTRFMLYYEIGLAYQQRAERRKELGESAVRDIEFQRFLFQNAGGMRTLASEKAQSASWGGQARPASVRPRTRPRVRGASGR